MIPTSNIVKKINYYLAIPYISYLQTGECAIWKIVTPNDQVMVITLKLNMVFSLETLNFYASALVYFLNISSYARLMTYNMK